MHALTFLYTAPGGQMTIDLAYWEILYLQPELEEIRVRTSQNTLNVVVGSGLLGKFVYFPDHGLGFPADDLKSASLCDDKLSEVLGYEDAAAVISALHDFASC